MRKQKIEQHPNDKIFKRFKRGVSVVCLCLAGLLFCLFFLKSINLEEFIPLPVLPLHRISWEEQVKLITVKVRLGEFWGSGILIAKKGNIYRVLTNDHVLGQESKGYLIYTPDGKVYQGTVIASASAFQGYDLAVLEFVSEGSEYTLAKLGKIPQASDEVLASGFPFPLMGEKSKGLVLHQGIVWGMLKKPLQGGYQLGYSNDIEKGMSGGPLLNKAGEVVAVNGMHAYPLLGTPYIYLDGTTPEKLMIDEMVSYSWGIPLEKVNLNIP